MFREGLPSPTLSHPHKYRSPFLCFYDRGETQRCRRIIQKLGIELCITSKKYFKQKIVTRIIPLAVYIGKACILIGINEEFYRRDLFSKSTHLSRQKCVSFLLSLRTDNPGRDDRPSSFFLFFSCSSSAAVVGVVVVASSATLGKRKRRGPAEK